MAQFNHCFFQYLFLRRKVLLLHAFRQRTNKSKRKCRRFWIRRLCKERDHTGEYRQLVRDLWLHDNEMFFRYFRMLPETFDILLGLVAPAINKKAMKMREPISADQRLLVTLQYLSTGDAHTTIAATYRISPTTSGRIISEKCNSLWDKPKEAGHIRTPSSVHAWKTIAREFEDRWNFPNMVGSIDGKHVQMFAPAGQASSFFTYKKTHSIVLLGVCDAKYKLMAVYTQTAI